MRIKLIIEYNGAAYSGWQRQDNLPTVQAVLEDALSEATGARVTLYGSGRTDAGVHACGQAAHFDTEADIPPDKYPFRVNKRLPKDIKIRESSRVKDDFHARFSAVSKTYLYKMHVSRQPSALRADTCLQVKPPLDAALMHEAAQCFVGTHDFRAFMSAASKLDGTPVRTVNHASVRQEGDEIHFTVNANAFLYNMVRVMAAQLIRAGKGIIRPADVAGMIESKNRRSAREIAGPQGLYLVEVYYPPDAANSAD
ncbi:MAG: tRNA pseudouridine(38-40) synthase TruA [Firmicutes bacterium]|nr:tRNA pseudouridine(38-40) synthase TruA [Bacillota bacterium]